MVLVLASILVSLVLLEAGFRVFTGVPVFAFANWRMERVQEARIGEHSVIDPEFGWTTRAKFEGEDFNTLDHGIRRNFDETTVRTGHILAVGDSFTEGCEVEDHESWPAYLEKKAGIPVLNGGISAYATDQIVMRAERLLPLVKPKILIVGFLEYDIIRAGLSHFGAPKPYFTLEGGELRYHPPAPFEPRTQAGAFSLATRKLREPLGYSALADYLFARLSPDYWYGTDYFKFDKISNDPVGVTCALLKRLKKQADAAGVRVLLFMQYYAGVIIDDDQPTERARRVMECARAAGIEVVDHFVSLRAIVSVKPDTIGEYYINKEGEVFTHMTPKGNEHAAEVLAKAIGK